MTAFKTPIEHLIVVMFENRSFDHLLGYQFDYPVGLKNSPVGAILRNTDPLTGTGYSPSPSAQWNDLVADPAHEPVDVYAQLYGGPWDNAPPNSHNVGFVTSYRHELDAAGKVAAGVSPSIILNCFPPGALPTLSTLATTFTVCGAWHSSVPGPTWPNRYFLHAGSSMGMVESYSTVESILKVLLKQHFPATVYSWVEGAGLTWKIYEHQKSQSRTLSPLHPAHGPTPPAGTCDFAPIAALWSDLKNGTLPHFSFIEPAWSGSGQNDMHPHNGSDMRNGDALLTTLYNALRSSSHWDNTALLVVFDEHGGTFDHVFPGPAVPPDDHRPDDYDFHFDRLGLRVPAIIVSAYSPKQVVMDAFDHTSVIASVSDLFGVGAVPAGLGKRAQAATPISGTFDFTSKRTDLPQIQRPAGAARPHYDAAAKLDTNQRLNLMMVAALAEVQSPELATHGATLSLQALTAHRTFKDSAKRVTATVDRIKTLGQLAKYLEPDSSGATPAPSPRAKSPVPVQAKGRTKKSGKRATKPGRRP